MPTTWNVSPRSNLITNRTKMTTLFLCRYKPDHCPLLPLKVPVFLSSRAWHSTYCRERPTTRKLICVNREGESQDDRLLGMNASGLVLSGVENPDHKHRQYKS